MPVQPLDLGLIAKKPPTISDGIEHLGPRTRFPWFGADDVVDLVEGAMALGRTMVIGCWLSLVRTYHSLPEWAHPIVWGFGIASPLVSAMFLARWMFFR